MSFGGKILAGEGARFLSYSGVFVLLSVFLISHIPLALRTCTHICDIPVALEF